ncbi:MULTISPECIES: hypothetical protein [Acinetobacter]|uniref:Uncharacterized protein n=1 Tax=Acinetobacter schindleri TaxID=108981 RepID=A0AAE7BX90_9GAMM|nr:MULTISPECIES: hypothetical protein [Acinetobacter]QIC67630.1 hypothetical protein FSC10_09725 [Acinetobacter schindleri]
MSNSPSHLPTFIHPAIQNLNIRPISKMIATKIIENTALQIQFNRSFCQELGVAEHLNTYQAVAYFTDNQYFEKYGFNRSGLLTMREVYNEIFSIFNAIIRHH